MMKMGLIKTLTVLLLTSVLSIKKTVQAVEAGWAFGMNNYAIDQSRLEIMAHLQRSLTKMNLPDYTIPFLGDNHFYANSFTPAPFNINDAEVYFQDGRLYVDIKRLDGRIEGLSWKKNIFGVTERFGFSCEGSNGSMSLKLVMMPSWMYSDGK